MKVTQVADFVNQATLEALGRDADGNPVAVATEDLSNIVDVGKAIYDADQVDNYVKKLVDRIGKVIFVNRTYQGSAPSVLVDGWEYGSVLEKISADLPEATENESWQLENGVSYDPNIFYQPVVEAKFYNSKVTFEVPMSFTDIQLKESFTSAEQQNSFISMIYNEVDKAMTVKLDSLVMRTINNFIASTLYAEYSTAAYTESSGVRAINLLYKYKQQPNADTTLTAANCISSPEFIRYAVAEMKKTKSRMRKISRNFNIGHKARFTPDDRLHTVLLEDFSANAGVYLYDGISQVNTGNIQLPEAETVPYWQGDGGDYSFSNISKIDVTDASNNTVTATGIIGVMFDRDALGVCNMNKRTTSNYNPKAEFYSNWAKMDAGYWNDQNENFVVYFVA